VAQLFSDNVYEGGALALYALRTRVGAAAFERIERAWVGRHAGGSAGTGDFIALASRVSRRDLRPFLRRWLYGRRVPAMPGHPGWRTASRRPSAAARAAWLGRDR
jgi:aminopeptidase N